MENNTIMKQVKRLGFTKSGKIIYDNFQENSDQNYNIEDHKDAYAAMNIQRSMANANYLSTKDLLSLEDRRYFGEEARKHHFEINNKPK